MERVRLNSLFQQFGLSYEHLMPHDKSDNPNYKHLQGMIGIRDKHGIWLNLTRWVYYYNE